MDQTNRMDEYTVSQDWLIFMQINVLINVVEVDRTNRMDEINVVEVDRTNRMDEYTVL